MLTRVYRWNDAMIFSLLCWYTHHPVIMALSPSGMIAAYCAAGAIGAYGAVQLLSKDKRN